MKYKKLLIAFLLISIFIFSSFNVFAEVNEEKREKARIHCQKAGELIKEDNWSGALNEAKAAASADPDYPGGHLLMAIVYVRQGELDLAEEKLKKTKELDPEMPEIYTYLGKVYYYRDNLDKALENYKIAVKKGTQEVLAYQDMGNIYYQQSRDLANSGGSQMDASSKMSLSIDNYKKAIEIEPNNSELHNSLGMALYAAGQLGNAFGEYKKAVELDKDNASAYSNLGEYYFYEKQDFQSAKDAYNKAITLYSEDISSSSYTERDLEAKRLELALCHFGLGSIYNYEENASKALNEFNEVLKIDSDNPMAHVGLASSYELQGNTDKAVEHFKKALDLAIEQNNTQLIAALEDKLKRMGVY